MISKFLLVAACCLLPASLASASELKVPQPEPQPVKGWATDSAVAQPTQAVARVFTASATNNLNLFPPGDRFLSATSNSVDGTFLLQFRESLKLEYAGSTLVHSETLEVPGFNSVKLRYVDGFPEFDTDPLKDTPQEREMRKRMARRMLLFGGNTFFWSEDNGTGLFLDRKKRATFLFTPDKNGLNAKFGFSF